MFDTAIERPGKRLKKAYDLRAQRAAEMRALLDTADGEKRSLTPEEKRQFEEAESFIRALDPQIENLVNQVDAEKHMRTVPGPADESYEQVAEREGTEIADRRFSRTLPPTMRDVHGCEVRALGPEHRLTDLPTKDSVATANLSFGKMIVGWATGRWPEGTERERRAMLESSNAAGGILVPESIWNDILDRARARSVYVAAGARTIVMPAENVILPRVDSDAVFAFKAEGAAFSESDLSFGHNTLTAQTFGAVVRASNELLADSPMAASAIEEALIRGIASSLDSACILGASGGIDGMLSNASIPNTGSIGSPTWEDLSSAATAIRAANFSPSAYACSPGVAEDLALLVSGDGATSAKTWLGPPSTLDGVQQFVSSVMPNDKLIMGDWQYALLGIRQQATLEISRDASDAFAKNCSLIRVIWRGDALIQRLSAFYLLTGIS